MCYRTQTITANSSTPSCYDSSDSPFSFFNYIFMPSLFHSVPVLLWVTASIFLLCLHCFHVILCTKAGTRLGNVCWGTLPAPPTDMYLFIEENKTTALWPAGPGMPACVNPFSTQLSFYYKLQLKL